MWLLNCRKNEIERFHFITYNEVILSFIKKKKTGIKLKWKRFFFLIDHRCRRSRYWWWSLLSHQFLSVPPALFLPWHARNICCERHLWITIKKRVKQDSSRFKFSKMCVTESRRWTDPSQGEKEAVGGFTSDRRLCQNQNMKTRQ